MTQPSAGEPSPDEVMVDNVQVRWPDDIGANAEAVNQVVFSYDQLIPDVVYMYLGHIAPPPWVSPEVAAERLTAVGGTLPITAKGAFALSRTRAEELWEALGKHLGKLPK
jgi:hypothetical protein